MTPLFSGWLAHGKAEIAVRLSTTEHFKMNKLTTLTLSAVLASLSLPALAASYQFHHRAPGLVAAAPPAAAPVAPEVIPLVVSL